LPRRRPLGKDVVSHTSKVILQGKKAATKEVVLA